jgi:quinol monooxygenase YgiN
MSKVAVIATIAVVPERRDEAVQILLRHRERCQRDEPGTLVFELMVPRDDADKVMLYEVYASQAAFETHWNGESLATCSREGDGFLSIQSGMWGTPAN